MTAFHLDPGQLELGDEAGRKFDSRVLELCISHRFAGTAAKHVQHQRLLGISGYRIPVG